MKTQQLLHLNYLLFNVQASSILFPLFMFKYSSSTLFFKWTQYEEFKRGRWKYLHKITKKCSNTVNEFQELLKVILGIIA